MPTAPNTSLHQALKEIKAANGCYLGDGKDIKSCSICDLVDYIEQRDNGSNWYITDLLSDLIRKWPESLHGDFVVPGFDGASAYAAFREAEFTATMWVGKYGRKRMELLDWLIKETAP